MLVKFFSLVSLMALCCQTAIASENKIAFKGVIRMDQATFNETTEEGESPVFSSGANLRSLTLYLNSDIDEDWKLYLDLVFKDSASMDMAFLEYKGLNNASLLIGQVPSPFCLEQSYSTSWLPFLEKSIAASTFSPCIGAGMAYTRWSDQYAMRFALTQPPYTSFLKDPDYGNDRWGGSFRTTYVPVNTPGHVVQLGLSGAYQDIARTMSFSSYPEIRGRNTPKLLNTGKMGAKNYNMVALEGAYQQERLKVSGEYYRAQVERRNTPEEQKNNFDGYSMQAEYFLTNHFSKYNFKLGNFGAPSSFPAWQVAVRRSYLNLEDKDIHGGQETNHSASLIRYLSSNMKLTLTYVHAAITPATTEGSSVLADQRKDKMLHSLGMRWQVLF